MHGLYGVYHDHDICITVLTDVDMAAESAAIVSGFIRITWEKNAVAVYSPGDQGSWLLFEKRLVKGLAGLMSGVSALAETLRLACLFRMQHPTDPDSKA